jgi:hypothetical protein
MMTFKSPRPFSMKFGNVGNVAEKFGKVAATGVRGAICLFSIGCVDILGGWERREPFSGSAPICVCGQIRRTKTLSMYGPDLHSLHSLRSQFPYKHYKKQRLKVSEIWEGSNL